VAAAAMTGTLKWVTAAGGCSPDSAICRLPPQMPKPAEREEQMPKPAEREEQMPKPAEREEDGNDVTRRRDELPGSKAFHLRQLGKSKSAGHLLLSGWVLWSPGNGIAAPDPGSGRNYCPGGEVSEQPWRP
jgi:hypothetical protein